MVILQGLINRDEQGRRTASLKTRSFFCSRPPTKMMPWVTWMSWARFSASFSSSRPLFFFFLPFFLSLLLLRCDRGVEEAYMHNFSD